MIDDPATFTCSELSAIPAGTTYRVIYADPPWRFLTRSEKGRGRSADRHYITQTMAQILLMGVTLERLLDKDCVLLMWTSGPFLPATMAVIERWGFAYKTVGFVWVKHQADKPLILHTGMGYWTRSNTEHCLFATRGKPKRLNKNVHEVIWSQVGEHSRKPQETHARIERLLPGPYLELYGRRPMPGWTVWGNEIERSLITKPQEYVNDSRTNA